MHENESIIRQEKKKKLIWVTIFFTIFAVILAVSLGVIFAPDKTAVLVNSSGDSTYYDSLDESSCNIHLEFDRYVDYGEVNVRFFDADNALLSSETYKLIGGRNETCYFYDIPGEVQKYDIVSYKAYKENYAYLYMPYIMIITCTITLTFSILGLCVKGKIYEYNEHEIFVFAGLKRHYLLIDGTIEDEFISITSYTPIVLDTTLSDGTVLKATISNGNGISLKINNRLVQGCKM